jgi:predicted ATPase
VADDRLVPAAAAYALGMTAPAGDVIAGMSSFLHDKSMLAVLDNCEHVVEGRGPAGRAVVEGHARARRARHES